MSTFRLSAGVASCLASTAVALALLSACGSRAPAPAGNATVAPSGASPAASAPLRGVQLQVFAAASLSDPFNEIGKQFEAANPGVNVAFNFGGSPQLRTQIEQGAPADVFASANQKEMSLAVDHKVIDGQSRVFAKNRLVVIVPRNNPGRVQTLVDLGRPGLKFVTTHKDVPVGAYTLSMLDKMSADSQYGADFKIRVLKNVISEEDNVKQVVAKVQLGEADAGAVYRSDVNPKVAPELAQIEVPDAFNELATYPIAVVAGSKSPVEAQAFTDFVLGETGQTILKQSNFAS